MLFGLFPLQFFIVFLCSVHLGFHYYVTWGIYFLITLFGVLYAFSTSIGTWGNLLLWFYWKYFLCLWPRFLFLPLSLLVVDWSVHRVPDYLNVLYVDFFLLDLTFSLTKVYISSILSSAPETHSFHLLYSVGEACLWGFCSSSSSVSVWVFNILFPLSCLKLFLFSSTTWCFHIFI